MHTEWLNKKYFSDGEARIGGQVVMISQDEMQQTFFSVLSHIGITEEKARACAAVFTTNSVDGVYTHGVNRFPVFVQYVQEGLVDKDAEPALNTAMGSLEQWNGNGGPGPLNALAATDRAVHLAQQYGMGCVALANTNHWMRGGYYGWRAAEKGYVLIAWTNTIANMPAWGAIDSRLGNNPLVIAVPYRDEAIVLDMAMSQYSFGAMEQAAAKGEALHMAGGFDKEGNVTHDPAAILASERPMPVGYWKGAGLSLLLDVLAAVLSGGLATYQISQQQKEHSVSQVFVCIDLSRLPQQSTITQIIDGIVNDYHHSQTEGDKTVRYPGEGVLQRRKENLQKGIPVLATVWEQILKLKP
ncbi:MAG TPA: 3-dehydro-L-gulonate 2-dehydrogenase [Flavisolibacter sp.]|jgi:3-dehydro-L-gulonate 2-dehydrogenase|nr:3-dehydro-L-gulonate 2-dehydrogenase [Flavisolibacter sp.]